MAKNVSLPTNRFEQWMICREPTTGKYANEPNPKKLYDDKRIAVRDAQQLCQLQGVPFYLLKVIAFVEPTVPQLPPTIWHNADEVGEY